MPKKDPFLRFSEILKRISSNMKPSRYEIETRYREEFGDLHRAIILFGNLARAGLAGSDVHARSPEFDSEELSVCIDLTVCAPLGECATIFFVFMDGFVFTQSQSFNENYARKKVAKWSSSQTSDLVGKLSNFFADFYDNVVPQFRHDTLSEVAGRRPLPRSRIGCEVDR